MSQAKMVLMESQVPMVKKDSQECQDWTDHLVLKEILDMAVRMD